MKNLGLLPELPREESDHILGALGENAEILTTDPLNFWKPYNPKNGYQVDKNGADLMACVAFSINDGYERFCNYLITIDPSVRSILDKFGCINEEGLVEFSDRFTAVMSGTNPNSGASVTQVCNSIRANGLLGEKWLEWDNSTMTKAQFYDRSAITKEIKDKAKDLLNYLDFLHAWVGDSSCDSNELKEALTKGVVRVSVDGAYDFNQNGYIYNLTNYTHSVLAIGGEEPKYSLIHDHYQRQYPMFIWGYRFGNGKLLYVKKKSNMILKDPMIKCGKDILTLTKSGEQSGMYKKIGSSQTFKTLYGDFGKGKYKNVPESPSNVALNTDGSLMMIIEVPEEVLFDPYGNVMVDNARLTDYLTSLPAINAEE